MILQRTIPLLVIVFFLTGCFRQAEDTFDTIESQNSDEVTITQASDDAEGAPTSEITVIDPNADAQSVDGEASATPRTIAPPDTTTEEDSEEPLASTTPLIIATATDIVPSSTPQVIPTATEPVFITPDINEQVAQPTATEASVTNTPTRQPSPTGEAGAEQVAIGECDYEIQDGDNLFRIAINNNVALSTLLSLNGLTEASIIQPGQIIQIPGCDTDSNEVTQDDDSDITVVPTIAPLGSCEIEIQSGDTLFNIALDNGISLEALLIENDLSEDSIIQPGQVVTLPDCDDGSLDDDDLNTPITGEATEEVTQPEQTLHTVATGDTILSIARQYGVTVNSILQANTIPNPNNLTIGQQLVIPDSD